MPNSTLGVLTAASHGGSFLLAMFIGWLVIRIGALRASIFTMSLDALATALGFAFKRDPTSFGIFYVVHTVLTGAYVTAAASLPMVLFPQLRFSQFDATAAFLHGPKGASP